MLKINNHNVSGQDTKHAVGIVLNYGDIHISLAALIIADIEGFDGSLTIDELIKLVSSSRGVNSEE